MPETNKEHTGERLLSIDNYASIRFEIPALKYRTSLLSIPDTKGRVRSIDIYDIFVPNFEPVIRQGKKNIVCYFIRE